MQVIAALVDLHAEEGEGSMTEGAKQKLGLHIRTLVHLLDFLTEEAKTSDDITFVSAKDTLCGQRYASPRLTKLSRCSAGKEAQALIAPR